MPLFQNANAQYRIKAGEHIVEALKDFDGSPKAVTAIVHEFMHPTVVEIFNGAKEGNETGCGWAIPVRFLGKNRYVCGTHLGGVSKRLSVAETSLPTHQGSIHLTRCRRTCWTEHSTVFNERCA